MTAEEEKLINSAFRLVAEVRTGSVSDAEFRVIATELIEKLALRYIDEVEHKDSFDACLRSYQRLMHTQLVGAMGVLTGPVDHIVNMWEEV